MKEKTDIPKREFFKALELILNSTIFRFNDKFYKQIFGVPIGSLLSPIVVDIVMHDLETKALQRFPISSSFYVKYVDDIALAYDILKHWWIPSIHSILD